MPNWDTMPNACGTPCPCVVGHPAQLFWDVMPSEFGCPSLLNEDWPAVWNFSLRIPDCNGFGDCSCLSNTGTLDETWKVDMSASNSTPLLKKENHLSASMPNILMKCPLRKTCPGKRLPVAAPSFSSSAALDSVTLRSAYCSAPADFLSSSLFSVLSFS